MHITPKDLASREYPEDKLIHWEIRAYRGESYVSLYWFKEGIPFDKEPINGLALYGYEISDNDLKLFADYIHKEFGGNVLRRSYRIFLENSKIIKDNKSLADLAEDISREFKLVSEIWLEFDGIEESLAKRLFNAPIIINK